MPDNDLFAIRKRITAAQQTRKITRTMELIASSRLMRGRALLAHSGEWLRHMEEAVKCLPELCFTPEYRMKKGDKKAYIVFGGSKGLSGSYSPSLLQYAKPVVSGHTVIAVGSGAAAFFPAAHSVFGDEIPCDEFARSIVKAAMAVVENGEADEVYLVYTKGVTQVTARLLPLEQEEDVSDGVISEPSAEALAPMLLEEYCEAILYEANLQAFVSEQIARVAAMDSATQNADEIIEDLQAKYNRIRQSTITHEIITVGNATRGDGSRV